MDTPFLKKIFASLLIKVSSTAMLFLISIILARLLGPNNYGIYSFCFSLVNILIIPALFGINVLMLREISSYQANKDWNHIKGILRQGSIFLASISIFIIFCAAIPAWIFEDLYSQDLLLCYLVSLALIPMFVFIRTYSSALRGFRHIILGQLPQLVIRPAIFLVLLFVSFFILSELTPVKAMALHAFSSGITLVLCIIYLYKKIPQEIISARPEYETKRWFVSALPLMFGAGLVIANNHITILIIGILKNAEMVGYYRVAVRAAELISFGLMSVNMVVAPTISRYFTKGDFTKLQQLITKCSRISFVITLPLGLGIITCSSSLLNLIYGQDFVQASIPLILLIIGQIFNSYAGSVALILNMTKNEKVTTNIFVFTTLLLILLDLLLIPTWGLNGAAIATSLTLMTWNIVMSIWINRNLKINTLAFS